MKVFGVFLSKFIIWLVCVASVSQVNAITQEEINKQNVAAEQACEANKNFSSGSGNAMLDAVSSSNYGFFWSLLKDQAKYQLCKQLTPKKLAELIVKHTPGLVNKINAIFDSNKADVEKGKDLEALIEEQMSPQYGYANNNKAHIRMAPALGLVRLGWEDDMKSQSCKEAEVGLDCRTDNNNRVCTPFTIYREYSDLIYPSYEIYRVVNGTEKHLGTVNGQVLSELKTLVNISFSSSSEALKKIGKELVKQYVNRLREKDSTIPPVVNVFHDAYADIYKNSVVRYKLVGKDPGNKRICRGGISAFSYFLDYDMNADGVPDFVDRQWYSTQLGKAYAPLLIPIINNLLLD